MFRDPGLKGWGKALWILFLVFVPFLAAFIYLIARGQGMTQRRVAAIKSVEADQTQYIRSAVASGPASEIDAAKKLLDAGTITEVEFTALKAKALA